MKSALVVTVGESRLESLGAMKLANWLSSQGTTVEQATDVAMYDQYELFAFSCVFSWHLPRLVRMVREIRNRGEVWIGGPAVTFSAKNAEYVERETGVKPHHGIDDRFETSPGKYHAVYFSRGCPAYTPACGLCPVPKIEGNKFRYYPDSKPAPLLLDNNLSALPEHYQEHIINRYLAEYPKNCKVDANSGFEPHTFSENTLHRWKRFPLKYWRFGFDDCTEWDESVRMMRLLKKHGYTGEKVRVYTLLGNEPIEDCHARIRCVIDHGCHPWPQRLRPLDYLGGPLPTRHDWDEPTLISYQRFYSNAALWKKLEPQEFEYQGRRPLRAVRQRSRVSLSLVV